MRKSAERKCSFFQCNLIQKSVSCIWNYDNANTNAPSLSSSSLTISALSLSSSIFLYLSISMPLSVCLSACLCLSLLLHLHLSPIISSPLYLPLPPFFFLLSPPSLYASGSLPPPHLSLSPPLPPCSTKLIFNKLRGVFNPKSPTLAKTPSQVQQTKSILTHAMRRFVYQSAADPLNLFGFSRIPVYTLGAIFFL